MLDELRRSSFALDDDELAQRLDVSPRQTINQVCRRLERAGRLHRRPGPNDKIVNDVRRSGEQQAATPTAEPVDIGMVSAGDSREQRAAEPVMLALLTGRTRGRRKSRRTQDPRRCPQVASRGREAAGRASARAVPQ
ncbi:MAG TPA: hypothetical protein VGP26_06340 [Actinophytocola sp.]|nr:hypothetical protein [Actinophytocola sp.]